MKRLMLVPLTTCAVLAGWFMPAGGQARNGMTLPTMFYNWTFLRGVTHNEFKVRPATITMDSADGGEYKLHWTSWTATTAVGVGYSYPDHGSFPVRVVAAYPIDGTFVQLTVYSLSPGRRATNVLHLGLATGPAKYAECAWLPKDYVGTPASGFMPYGE